MADRHRDENTARPKVPVTIDPSLCTRISNHTMRATGITAYLNVSPRPLVLRLEAQPPHFSQDSDDLSSRARVTVPGFRTARSVASRR